MNMTVTQKLIESHLMHGDMKPGEENGIRSDQTLTQDATGTLLCRSWRRRAWTG